MQHIQQENKKIKKPSREIVEQFREFGTATISSALREVCGIRRAFMMGPVAFTSGKKAVGTAVTLQFLPKREDIEPGQTEEEQESTSALWSVFHKSCDQAINSMGNLSSDGGTVGMKEASPS